MQHADYASMVISDEKWTKKILTQQKYSYLISVKNKIQFES